MDYKVTAEELIIKEWLKKENDAFKQSQKRMKEFEVLLDAIKLDFSDMVYINKILVELGAPTNPFYEDITSKMHYILSANSR